MKRVLSDKQKKMAYVLNKDSDFNCTMNKIGELFGVTQPTISNAIKDVAHELEIKKLAHELEEVKQYIVENNICKQQPLLPHLDRNK